MNPYEVETVTRWGSDCPECGCTFYYEDIHDIFYEVTVVKDTYGYIEAIDGYTEWSEDTFVLFSSDADHSCGCNCYWNEYDDPTDGVQDAAWPEDKSTTFACGECERQYVVLHQAKSCCKKEEFSEDQLVAELFGRESARKN